MARFEHLIEKRRREQRGRRLESTAAPFEVARSEWRSAPLGRLGRRLQVDVERYLEFFAIARDDAPVDRSQERDVASRRTLSVTRSMLDL